MIEKEKTCHVGRCTESKCPKCGRHIDYNGNFFCHDIGNDCDWGLPAWPFDNSRYGGRFPMTDLRTVLVAIELGVINEQGDLL